MASRPGQGQNTPEKRKLHGTRVKKTTEQASNLGPTARKRYADLQRLYQFHISVSRRLRKMIKTKSTADVGALLRESRAQSDAARQLAAQLERFEARMPAAPVRDDFTEFD